MSAPQRIQRRRTKGWKMPEGAVYVGRPTKWGNPFWHAQRYNGLDAALALYRESVAGCWNPKLVEGFIGGTAEIAYRAHCDFVRRFGEHPTEAVRRELRGKDLVCWCTLDAPCHADVLLEISNR